MRPIHAFIEVTRSRADNAATRFYIYAASFPMQTAADAGGGAPSGEQIIVDRSKNSKRRSANFMRFGVCFLPDKTKAESLGGC